MKAIKNLGLWLGLALAAACSDDDVTNQMNPELTPFVRINFLVNNNDIPLEFPQQSASAIPQSTYTHGALRTIKVPVSLTARSLEGSVMVDYAINSTLPETVYEVSPSSLELSVSQPTDTIFIAFTDRWEAGSDMTLELTGVSNPEVQIGTLNDTAKLDALAISLGEVTTTFALSENRIELQGEAGEKVRFDVNFPNGYIPSEIDDTQLFSFLNGFDYTLERVDENPSAITYEITLTENINLDEVSYQTVITLEPIENYTLSGTSRLLLVKPVKTDRDIRVNPAANFYNVADPFYRTFGENWLDHDADGVCDWRSFNAFTLPVVVDEDDPNAILFSDNGTPEPEDDIYHDAFRIGFVSPIANRTTNPFNLQRWFNNEATTADVSPGFNIPTALEFYPQNGNSETGGVVQVVPQFLTISNREGVVYELAISGDGTYRDLGNGLWEISMELKVTNQELFGGTVTSEYVIYNLNAYEDPAPLTNNCVTNIDI